MSRLLMIAGAVLALPGPSFLVLVLGAVLGVVGAAVRNRPGQPR